MFNCVIVGLKSLKCDGSLKNKCIWSHVSICVHSKKQKQRLKKLIYLFTIRRMIRDIKLFEWVGLSLNAVKVFRGDKWKKADLSSTVPC